MSPDQYTLSELMLPVGNGHTLYVQEWGNKNVQTPILFLHGGPGGSCKDRHKQIFNPARERVIFFDQRGCGKSTPYGSLEHNQTKYIVEDIEKILSRLGVESVILHGGSWGCALALFYGLAHPPRVKAMVLHGIWTSTQSENDWLDKGGFRTFYPEVWEQYAASVPSKYRHDPSSYHFPRILGNDPEAIKASGYAYESLEGSAISLDDRFTPDNFDEFDPSGIQMEAYYLTNLCFMPDRYILDNASKLTMPIWLVQGRYDMVCPPTTAYELHKALPQSELLWTMNGHKAEHESWNLMRTLMLQLSESA